MSKESLGLSEGQRSELEAMRAKGQGSARLFKRVTAILLLGRGTSVAATAEAVGVSQGSVRTWRRRYEAEGVAGLHERPRSGRPIELDGAQRAKITALACSEAPEGYAKWSLRLLADKAVELELCEHVSHSQVATILKKTR